MKCRGLWRYIVLYLKYLLILFGTLFWYKKIPNRGCEFVQSKRPKLCFITSNINNNCTWKHILQVGNGPHGCEFGGLVQHNVQTYGGLPLNSMCFLVYQWKRVWQVNALLAVNGDNYNNIEWSRSCISR